MKKISIICFICTIVLVVFSSCSSSIETPNTEAITTIQPSSTSLDDVSISFPEEFVVQTGVDDEDWGFQRQYRFAYYSLSNLPGNISVSQKAFEKWGQNETDPYWVEPAEPRVLSFIKKFDVSFVEFEREVKTDYSFQQQLGVNFSDEGSEPHNPYMLYTFNLARINDYYSLDPARHTSAVKWLEEWLQTNEPYESYAEYRKAKG